MQDTVVAEEQGVEGVKRLNPELAILDYNEQRRSVIPLTMEFSAEQSSDRRAPGSDTSQKRENVYLVWTSVCLGCK